MNNKLTVIKRQYEMFTKNPKTYLAVLTVEELGYLLSLLEEKDSIIKKNDEEIESMLHAFQVLQMENSKLEKSLEEKDKALTYIQERAEFELDIENTNTYNLSNGLTMIRQKAYEAINTSSNNEREV